MSGEAYAAPAGTGIGHVHLRVADLERAVAFYAGVLGFVVQQRIGSEAAFLGAPLPGGGHYHHHIGLNVWDSAGGGAPPRGHTGLYHAAILYPDRTSLGRAVARMLDAGHPITGATDHGVSEAVYLDDPDGNGLELYHDRPPNDWPRDGEGRLAMTCDPLDIDGLVRTTRQASGK